MPTSDTDIVNRALRLLKATEIASLTDGSKNANVANNVYSGVCEDLIRQHNWNFATRRTTLSRLSTTPTSEFDYGYALPSDWIRTVSVSDNDANVGYVFYKEEELEGVGVILSSAETLYFRYIYSVTDPNRFPPDFVTAFVYALAVAMPGIGNISAAREAELVKEAKSRATRAKSADAMGSSPERRPPGSWVSSRGSWRRHRDWIR